MDEKTLVDLFRDLLYIRMVEERVCDLYSEQEMRCPVHISIGQEATAVGLSKALNKEDLVFSNHRCHGHYLAKGGNLKKFFSELYGKATGCSGGRGGSMHLIDTDVGFSASTPIVSGTIPIAVGSALAFSIKNENKIAVSFFGEAAIEEGSFHESINFAKLMNLPIIFFCENNLYSVYTPLEERQPKKRISNIARANGLITYEIDGNDVVQVYKVCKEAVEKIRNDEGPIFIEASTYRWREHCGPNYDNHLGYRSIEEFFYWKDKDPLKKMKDCLLKSGTITENEIRKMEQEINILISEAVEFAKESPYPNKDELNKFVYAD